MTHGNGNGVVNGLWRTIAIGLAGVLVAGFGSWMLFDRDQPNRGEVTQLVDDRIKVVTYQLTETTARLEQLTKDTKEIRDAFNRVLGRLEAIATKGKP